MNVAKIIMLSFNKFIRMIKNGSYMAYSKIKMFRTSILFFFKKLKFFNYFSESNSQSNFQSNCQSNCQNCHTNYQNDFLSVFNSTDNDFIDKQVKEIISLIRKEEESRKSFDNKKKLNDKLNKLMLYKLNKYKSVIQIGEKISKENDREKKEKFNNCLLSILQLENKEIMKNVFKQMLEKNKRKNSIEISYTPSPEPHDFEIIDNEP